MNEDGLPAEVSGKPEWAGAAGGGEKGWEGRGVTDTEQVCLAGPQEQAEQEAARMAGLSGTYGRLGGICEDGVPPYFPHLTGSVRHSSRLGKPSVAILIGLCGLWTHD